ncbi:Methylcrotonyl-CoA carboxylase alpha chai isoform 1 [Hibiscus syriacus]|uniref:Methylcrotonyl-CoA carboxylase alpha chai isoform 1 n=1 Tax=Hibiscus syriacus TaxID=106335 RepID=A0A6A3ATX8_HIBSY|nr:Methylcrotonyl-CoA carboxylase alpha chai isoform 1 [Hibiscus syriacus]
MTARGLNERASKAEAEVQTLKDVLAKLGAEREAKLVQYQICLEKINNLENSLSHALNEAAELNMRASEAEVKAQALIKDLARVEAEKEDSIARYKQCSETKCNLEEKLSNAEECARRMTERAEKAESELETLKQEDIGTRNQGLEDELQRVKEENKDLNELKLSSAMSITNLQDEILSLRETIAKLDAGVELRVDQRNALQQEIYCLKEELNEFNKRHQDMTGKLESVCLNPENFASSVKALQEENTKLKDVCKRDSDEKLAILQKLKLMEELDEKNALLENSLSDLSIELEVVRGRVKTLEESCQSLLKEKSILIVEKDALISQLQIATQNLEKLSEKNNFMENSLIDSSSELEELREKLTSLEHSCMCLGDEKSVLITQREYEEELHKAMNAQVEIFILQKCAEDLEEKNVYLSLECRKLLEANKVSEKFISELETENSVNQMVMKSVCDQISMLRMGLYQMLTTLEIDVIHGYDDKIKEDQSLLDCVFGRLQEMQDSLTKSRDENQQLVTENSVLITLLGQLKLEAENLVSEKNSLHQELRLKSELFFYLYSRTEKLSDLNEELRCKETEGGQREEVLQTKIGEQQMLSASHEERGQLQKVVEDLTSRYDEVMLSGEDQKSQIPKLSRDYDRRSMGTESIHHVNKKIETELLELNEEIDESKHWEESLSVELQKELWENQADAFFLENQISAVHEALLEQKAHEICNECEILGRNSKAVRVEELEISVRILEHNNGGLEAQLAAAHNPVIVSLLESMTSLESETLLHPKLSSGYNEEFKDKKSGTDLRAEQISEYQIASVSHVFSDLQGIHLRIKAIETAVVEMERLAVLENINLNSKLETAMRQIKELRSGNSSRRESITAKGHVNARQEGRELSHGLGSIVEIQRPTTEISEEDNEMMTKDIMLDQISECTSYVISRKETDEVNNQMLEIGETVEHDGSANWKIGKAQNMVTATTDYEQIGTVKGHKSRNPSTESLVKELVVDKEGSERFTKPNQEGSKRKILERLGSDAQKLANLQITAQDLKRKVEITETGEKGKGTEYCIVKKQLEEADETITKLGDANRKLMTQVEDGSWYRDGKSALESDEIGSVRKQGVLEQAQRESEKLRCLQLELQKIQFLILQLDDGKGSTVRTRIADSKIRVQLRDYIYGGRNIPKKKKARFCACVKPSTKGD